eukprot:1139838-Pelagomonas_calceolata.AAC.2
MSCYSAKHLGKSECSRICEQPVALSNISTTARIDLREVYLKPQASPATTSSFQSFNLHECLKASCVPGMPALCADDLPQKMPVFARGCVLARSVYEASCYSQQAHGLLERLIKENRDMTVRWEEDAAGHQRGARWGAGPGFASELHRFDKSGVGLNSQLFEDAAGHRVRCWAWLCFCNSSQDESGEGLMSISVPLMAGEHIKDSQF